MKNKEINLYSQLMELKSSVPLGKSGDWLIEEFTVSKDDAEFFNMRQMVKAGGRGRDIKAGTYKRLYRGGKGNWGTTIMSDTPAEKRDHIGFIREAEGDILVNGLGLGWVIEGLFLKSEVRHVTVIEISKDVIKLTGKYLQDKFGDRLTIINKDALEYKLKKNEKYDFVWHDIWDDICADNWETMTQLHKKYARKCKFQDSWVRDRVKYLRRVDY
jgi:hypothetical protein